MFKYPNQSYHDNCGPHVHWAHRRIDKSTPATKMNCFFGVHVRKLKSCSPIRASTYHCKFCYQPMEAPE